MNVYQGVAHCTQLRHGSGAGIYPCPAASLGIYLPAQQQGLAFLAVCAGVGVKAVFCEPAIHLWVAVEFKRNIAALCPVANDAGICTLA